MKAPLRRPLGWKLWLLWLSVCASTCALGLLAMEFGIRKYLPFFDPRTQILWRVTADGITTGAPLTRRFRDAQGGLPGDGYVQPAEPNRPSV